MDLLPDEMLINIFKYLSRRNLIRVSKVNRRFKRIALLPEFWDKNLCIFITPDDDFYSTHKPALTIPDSKMASFCSFLKKIPSLTSINIRIKYRAKRLFDLSDLRFESIRNLRCLEISHQSSNVLRNVSLPSTLRHVTLYVDNSLDDDDLSLQGQGFLINVADSCPQLEHLSISTFFTPEDHFHDGLDYLLRKAKMTIRSLHCVSTYLTNKSYLYLSECQNLDVLFIEVCMDLLFLASSLLLRRLHSFKNLVVLILDIVQCSVPICEVFIESTNIRVLCLSGYEIDRQDFEALANNLPKLLILHLSYCHMDFDGLINFIQKCRTLKELALDGGVHFDELSVKLLELFKFKPELNSFELYVKDCSIMLNYPRSSSIHHIKVKPFDSFRLAYTFFEIVDHKFSCLLPVIKMLKKYINEQDSL